MNKRPLSVTIIGWLFVVAGAVGLAYHGREFLTRRPIPSDLVLVCFVRLLAIVFAAFLLRGHNWARWMLLAWIAYHVGLSVFHSASEVIVHALLLVVVAYFLFRRPASAYFRGAPAQSAPEPAPATSPPG